MAKLISQHLSNGDVQPRPERLNLNGNAKQPKTSKKPMKSNITNKIKSRHSGGQLTSGETQGEDEEADSSAFEESPTAAEEPDAFALPGARQQSVGAARRLAGLEEHDDDMFQDIDMNAATAGAEQIIAASDDDDNYGDVENLSDSDVSEAEDDERSVLRSAEQDLIDEFERTEDRRHANMMMNDMSEMAIQEDEALARRLSLQGTESHLEEFSFEIDVTEDPFLGLGQNDNLYNDLWNEAESALWRMPESARRRESSDPASNTQKRVRFEEIHDRESSSSGSEDPNEAFPDLFAASDDPLVKQRILGLEQDMSASLNDFGDTESFYDFEDEDEKLAFELDEESDSDEDQSSDSSDDGGDTTDEETAEEQIARMQQMKRAAGKSTNDSPKTPLPSQRPGSSGASTPSTPRPVTPKTCKGPRTGTFAIDPTRAAMTTDPQGRKIKIIPPSKPPEKDREFWERARSANSSRNGSPRNSSYLTMPSPGAENVPPRPFTAKSTLGSMFNGNLDILRNNDHANIADDLFPKFIGPPQSSFTTNSTTEDSDFEQPDINMQDFVDIDPSDSDSDMPQSAPITSPVESGMRDSFSSSNGHNEDQNSGLLNHFDHCRGAVGSFRRNQSQAKHISSLPSHPAKRASTHEYNALQKGRRGAANTPMTPARKKRASQDLSFSNAGVRKSVNSPLTSRRPRSRGNSLAGMTTDDLFQTLIQTE